MNIVLTKVTTPVIGWICSVLGWIINAIYAVLEAIGIPNIGLAIILFTLVIYMLMMPLQIKQQKFSKLNSIMQPEIQKIQKKYKNKKDQDSMMKQNEEVNAVYQKYGVSPTGSCLQLIIQMPVLLALYQVIYHIPGYIAGVRDVFAGLANKIMSVNGIGDIISKFLTDEKITLTGISPNADFSQQTSIVDFLYKLSPSQMDKFSDLSQFSSFSELFDSVSRQAGHMNNFLTLNISDTPLAIVKSGWAQGGAAGYLLVFAAIMIPVLAWFTQWMNYKLMPQPQSTNDQPSAMESSMKSMNTIMPVMSAVFCFSFPVGIGIYWVIGAVIRSVQQLVINKHMEKVDMEELIRHNQEKMKKKLEKQGLSPQKINQQARMNVRNIQEPDAKSDKPGMSEEEKAERLKKSTEYYNNTNAKPGSLAAKANMVKQFDEKNNKNRKK
ncbi:MAG: YidC/Oxa1 family membrane protein insertase [Clostridia bacterium]|nr:YidC/Oxa1 family membrane protein insertase [Clostridia bacterium]